MNDKKLHFLFSFFLVTTFAHITTVSIAFIITLFIGLVKEIYDFHSPSHNAEWLDVVADITGSIFGVIFLIIAQYIV